MLIGAAANLLRLHVRSAAEKMKKMKKMVASCHENIAPVQYRRFTAAFLRKSGTLPRATLFDGLTNQRDPS
jgi:hypothetical protein